MSDFADYQEAFGYQCEHGSLKRQCPLCDCEAELQRLRAGIIKARDALDNYDYDTSLFAIIEELDDLLGDTDV